MPELKDIVKQYIVPSVVDAYIIIYGVMYVEEQIMFLVYSKKDLFQHFENQEEILKNHKLNTKIFLPNDDSQWVIVKCVKNNKLVNIADFYDSIDFKDCGTCIHSSRLNCECLTKQKCNQCEENQMKFRENLQSAISLLPNTKSCKNLKEEYTIVNFYHDHELDCGLGRGCTYCEEGDCKGECGHVIFTNGVWLS